MTCEHLIWRYLPYKARKETGNEPAWPLSQYENEKTYALGNNDLNQVWRPAVLVKTRVWMGCSVSSAHKTWSRSLLFEDSHENGAEANNSFAGANTVCRQYKIGSFGFISKVAAGYQWRRSRLRFIQATGTLPPTMQCGLSLTSRLAYWYVTDRGRSKLSLSVCWRKYRFESLWDC